MENLSSEIILEILSRLPMADSKSILQCRKVCKLWYSLLGNPLMGMLFANNIAPAELYYRDQFSEIVGSHFTEEHLCLYKRVAKIGCKVPLQYVSLVGSCNGLVCYKVRICEYLVDRFMCITNPITEEIIRLPGQTRFECAGFGYCHSTNAYKVLRIFYASDSYKQNVQVYTLGDGNGWRDKQGPALVNYFDFMGSGVFAFGALHWLITRRGHSDTVYFDLTDETFQSLPLPTCYDILYDSHTHIDLGSIRGNLYMCARYTKQGEHMLDIWVFEKQNMNNSREWNKVLSRKSNSDFTQKCQLISLTLSKIVLWVNGVLSCHDRTTSTTLWCAKSAIRNLPADPYIQAIPYTHSLVSLKDLGEELVNNEDVHPES